MHSFCLPGVCSVNTLRKTEVLSIKTTPEIKHALRAIAAREHRSMANALETLVMDYFARNGLSFPPVAQSAGEAEESADARGSK